MTNYAVFAKSVLARFTRFCVEKNRAKNWIGGEKMTNMRYEYDIIVSFFHIICSFSSLSLVFIWSTPPVLFLPQPSIPPSNVSLSNISNALNDQISYLTFLPFLQPIRPCRTLEFWRAIIAECVATFFLLVMICSVHQVTCQ